MTSSVILQGQMRDFQCSGHIVTCRAPARAPLCTAAKSVGNWALPTLHCTEAPLSLHCRERYRRVYDALDLAGLLKVIRDLNMMYYWESWWHRNAVNACQPWVVAVTLLMHWMLNIFQGLNQFENRISFKNWNEVIGAVPFIRVKNQLVALKRAPVVQWSIEHCIQGGVGVTVEQSGFTAVQGLLLYLGLKSSPHQQETSSTNCLYNPQTWASSQPLTWSRRQEFAKGSPQIKSVEKFGLLSQPGRPPPPSP